MLLPAHLGLLYLPFNTLCIVLLLGRKPSEVCFVWKYLTYWILSKYLALHCWILNIEAINICIVIFRTINICIVIFRKFFFFNVFNTNSPFYSRMLFMDISYVLEIGLNLNNLSVPCTISLSSFQLRISPFVCMPKKSKVIGLCDCF